MPIIEDGKEEITVLFKSENHGHWNGGNLNK